MCARWSVLHEHIVEALLEIIDTAPASPDAIYEWESTLSAFARIWRDHADFNPRWDVT